MIVGKGISNKNIHWNLLFIGDIVDDRWRIIDRESYKGGIRFSLISVNQSRPYLKSFFE